MSNQTKTTKVLVLGASGMLGNAVLRFLCNSDGIEVFGTVRSNHAVKLLPPEVQHSLISGIDVENMDSLLAVFAQIKPDFVINCIGLVKQLSAADDPLSALPINSLLPHRLARLCALSGTRFAHMSTDCVFSGSKGMYTEDDISDAKDLYGRSKYLGEVDYPNAITLRTSIIGHELDGERGLIGWFLAQQGTVKGFRKAIFSGLPTVEIARIIRDFVIPRPNLHGLYHVSAEPISKFDLLKLVARTYQKPIDVEADEDFCIDRSLDSTRFREETGYQPPSWPQLACDMSVFG